MSRTINTGVGLRIKVRGGNSGGDTFCLSEHTMGLRGLQAGPLRTGTRGLGRDEAGAVREFVDGKATESRGMISGDSEQEL